MVFSSEVVKKFQLFVCFNTTIIIHLLRKKNVD